MLHASSQHADGTPRTDCVLFGVSLGVPPAVSVPLMQCMALRLSLLFLGSMCA